MEVLHKINDNDKLFEFSTYEEFTKERLKLNYESALEVWYSLEAVLPDVQDNIVKRHTHQRQRTIVRKIIFFYLYSKLFKRTCLKKQIQAKGNRLCKDLLNLPPSSHLNSFYDMYQSMVRIAKEFRDKGKKYDPSINRDYIFKADRLLLSSIGLQILFNLPLEMTDSIFGYNMLYPYTDDFIDCTSVSQEAKKDFAKLFHERLLIGESNYDPKSHFDGQPSNATELRLTPILQPYADKISKIFDMVKFIENHWTRRGEHECVYMSLAAIHDAQMKSTLQHARPDDGYAPTMAEIERVSAEKGGASMTALGFLLEGRLTRGKMAYLEYSGFGLQLVDDLQDVERDMKNNHRTIFTQSIAEGQTLDLLTARLIRYCYDVSIYEKYANELSASANSEDGVALIQFVLGTMMKAAVILILEAASRLPQYYSREFYRELEKFSPFPFKILKMARIEKKLMSMVDNKWF